MRSSRPKSRVAFPSKNREPEVGRSRSRKSLARVVLPDPDSPTMPRVSPSATCTLTPSSALIQPRALAMVNPLVTGKYFVSPIAWRITAASHSDRRSHPAGRHVPALHRDRRRRNLLADGLALRTPRGERAAGRQARQVGGLSADLDERLALAAGAGQTSQQRTGVRMTGVVEDLERAAHLDDLPGVHHRDPIGVGRDDAEVVR